MRTLAIIAALLVGFAVVSMPAAMTKNPTIDEPTHALSGWLELTKGEFRYEAVNPSLWKMYAAIGNAWAKPRVVFDGPLWKDAAWDAQAEVAWSCRTLFQTQGNDADAFVNRARAMMLIVGVGLGATIGAVAYRFGKSVAAIGATAMYCVDPNFLAHAPLVKSDVMFALDLFVLAAATWRLGRRWTWPRAVVVSLLCGVACNTKFSGVIVGPMLASVLLLRVVLPMPWSTPRGAVLRWPGRFGMALGTGLLAAGCCVVVTWGCYGFRYRPSTIENARIDINAIAKVATSREATAVLNRQPTADELLRWPASATTRFVLLADEYHLLPQSMLAGLLYQHACVTWWEGYLDGELYFTGRVSYYPKAILYKTPVATLVAFGLALLAIRPLTAERLWTAAAFVIPPAVFLAAALVTHLNIGVRNVLPLYPFAYLGVGTALAAAWRRRPAASAVAGGLLFIATATESLSAYPNFIPFFNTAAGGERGGIHHLGDSNLDWGQDVAAIAAWQRVHPGIPLYVYAFTSLDPAYYGAKFDTVTIIDRGPDVGHVYNENQLADGVIAVSTTHLQGLYLTPPQKMFIDRVQRGELIDSLGGGTICIFRFRK